MLMKFHSLDKDWLMDLTRIEISKEKRSKTPINESSSSNLLKAI